MTPRLTPIGGRLARLAAAQAAGRRLQLVLSADVRPDMDGWALAARACAGTGRPVPQVVLLRSLGRHAGGEAQGPITAILRRPISTKDLRRTLEALLGGASAAPARELGVRAAPGATPA